MSEAVFDSLYESPAWGKATEDPVFASLVADAVSLFPDPLWIGLMRACWVAGYLRYHTEALIAMAKAITGKES